MKVFNYLLTICASAVMLQTTLAQNHEIDLVNSYLAAAFNRDYKLQASLMHQDIVDYHPTVLQPPAKGKEVLIDGWKNSFKSMDSVYHKSHGLGLVHFKTGRYKGRWVLSIGELNSYVNGNKEPILSQMIGLYRIEQNKIIEVRNYGNILDMYLQMGFTIQPPKTIKN